MCIYMYVCIYSFIYTCPYIHNVVWSGSRVNPRLRSGTPWPLHEIAMTNLVRCMACTRGVGGGSYLAQ